MHASNGKRLKIMQPDVNTQLAIHMGFVYVVADEDIPAQDYGIEINGDMPQLAIRPNAKDWDAATMIRRAMETHKDNPPDKAITIFLWDVDGKYDTVFFNSGLSIMQAVALLEKIKHDLLTEMEAQHGKEADQAGGT